MKLKRIAIYALLILNLISSSGHSAFATSCFENSKDWLKNTIEGSPETLAFAPHSARVVGELASAGHILAVHEKLPSHLADGSYIYVISSDGTLGFSPRIPDPRNLSEPLSSHRAIYQKLKDLKKIDPQIIAAGEFEISAGRVAQVNNKSGTFRGGQKQLNLAKEMLQKKGLKIEPKTVFTDYATAAVPGKHNTELENAQAYVNLHRDPKLKALFDLMEKNRKVIYQHYPAETPGKMNITAFLTSDTPRLSQHYMTFDEMAGDRTRGGTVIVFLLEKSQDFTENAFTLQRMIHEMGYEKTRGFLSETMQLEGAYLR